MTVFVFSAENNFSEIKKLSTLGTDYFQLWESRKWREDLLGLKIETECRWGD